MEDYGMQDCVYIQHTIHKLTAKLNAITVL